MTTKPKAPRYRIRRSEPPKPNDDGFGAAPFPGSAKADATPTPSKLNSIVSEIRAEGLTGRQLRIARRLAQKHGLEPSSDFDAVRLLRAQGIDPFGKSAIADVATGRDVATTEAPVRAGLPQTVTPIESRLPAQPLPAAEIRRREIDDIRDGIARRRRARLRALVARLAVFVLLPTIGAFYYFAFVATPSFATNSNFVVQQAEAQAVSGGMFGGTALASSQDSTMVQDFLGSREAMLRLDEEEGYRDHFSAPGIDWWQRVEPGATNEALYDHYQKHVRIGFDPTEGVIRMEVTAMTPEASQRFSEALISYAEERVDQVTERKRSDQMEGARDVFDEAEAAMKAAQAAVVDLQGRLGVLDPASESSSVMTQVSNFETQLAEKRLQLQQLLDNRRPNEARVAGVRGDIERLETLVADLRSQLTTTGSAAGSLAQVTAELRMAEVDLETRTMLMQEALQQMENARVEANRQVRYLSTGMRPVPPDEPTYPNVLQNTLIAFLSFSAIYLLASLTVSILREQVSN